MAPPKRFTESMLIRLPGGTRQRIETLQEPGELLADTQRRVVLVGLDSLERKGVHKVVQKPGGSSARTRKR